MEVFDDRSSVYPFSEELGPRLAAGKARALEGRCKQPCPVGDLWGCKERLGCLTHRWGGLSLGSGICSAGNRMCSHQGKRLLLGDLCFSLQRSIGTWDDMCWIMNRNALLLTLLYPVF